MVVSTDSGEPYHDGSESIGRDDETPSELRRDFCTLYIAPSTIPGAGLGTFTSVPRKVGDHVEEGSICIPLVDLDEYNNWRTHRNPFANYYWSSTSVGIFFESDKPMDSLCLGMGCTPNCLIPLINTRVGYIAFDDGKDLHRSKDPGVGAFTPYINLTSLAIRDIPAGGEIFVSYGDEWFQDRKHLFKNFPLTSDYSLALSLLLNYTNLSLTINDQDSLWNDLHQILLKAATGVWKTPALSVLPQSLSEVRQVTESQDFGVIHQPYAIRSPSWLAENGRCLDHIHSGKSTLPQAGQGAFASRPLQKGSIVATSPLFHVQDRSLLDMYDLPKKPWQRNALRYIHTKFLSYQTLHRFVRYPGIRQHQLLMNYCYGHRASTLLLCPYLHGVSSINHDKRRANVKIQWATDFSIAHDQELVDKGTLSDLASIAKPTLAFDYIATRDIEPGEELFLDYGDEWEAAWGKHNEEFSPPRSMERYASAAEMNILYGDAMLYTDEEEQQQTNLYESNVIFRCHIDVLSRHEKGRARNFVWSQEQPGHPCYILERNQTETGEFRYKLEVGFLKDKLVKWVILNDVPRSAIRFFDTPYTTDLHLPFAFRHDIRIPDIMFPKQWRNRNRTGVPQGMRVLGLLIVSFMCFYSLFSFLAYCLEATRRKEKRD